MNCPQHPEIELPEKLTCPKCAQEARRKAYEEQRRIMQAQLQWGMQGLLRPAQNDEET